MLRDGPVLRSQPTPNPPFGSWLEPHHDDQTETIASRHSARNCGRNDKQSIGFNQLKWFDAVRSSPSASRMGLSEMLMWRRGRDAREPYLQVFYEVRRASSHTSCPFGIGVSRAIHSRPSLSLGCGTAVHSGRLTNLGGERAGAGDTTDAFRRCIGVNTQSLRQSQGPGRIRRELQRGSIHCWPLRKRSGPAGQSLRRRRWF